MTTMNRGPKRRTMLMLAGALALGLAGCETLDPKVVQGRLAGKSVAVASTLGPNVRLIWIGTTVFNNEYGELPAAEWQLDRLAAEKAAEALTASGRYGSVTIATGATQDKAGALVLPAGTAADYVVAISSANAGDPIFATNQNLSGVGLAQRTVGGGSGRASAYAAVKLVLRDATGKEIGSAQTMEHVPVALRMTSGSPSPVVAAGDQPALRDATREQLARAVADLLRRAGLN